MTNQALKDCKHRIDKLRLPEDIKEDGTFIDPRNGQILLNELYSRHLLVTEEITPEIFNSIKIICNRLKFNIKSIICFIISSHEINASCFQLSEKKAILRINSGLINLLNEKELQFILGHEIGHFLLTHSLTLCSTIEKTIENDPSAYLKSRYQEISADRIGLIACNCLDSALKAKLKLSSGLTSKYLRFDVSKYISQIEKTNFINQENFSTHPSTAIRVRALLWFHLETDINAVLEDKYNSNNHRALDDKIKKDFIKYDDAQLFDKITNEYKIWLSIYQIAKDLRFDKNEQEIFKKQFGMKELKSAINFLKATNTPDIKDFINTRLRECLAQIKPYKKHFKKELIELEDNIKDLYNKPPI